MLLCCLLISCMDIILSLIMTLVITANNLVTDRTMIVYDIADHDMYGNPELGYYYKEKCNQRLTIGIATVTAIIINKG